jgi:hypothetical protein
MSSLTTLLPKLVAFVTALVVGAVVVSVVAASAGQAPLVPTATEAPPVVSVGLDDAPLSFDLIDTGDADVIATEPDTDEVVETTATTILDAREPKWHNPSDLPRITPITQFDGGPFQNANCTLAAGAMLARLGFNIRTTGSVLRTLQYDQVGGTGLDDLQVALWAGYGVTVPTGLLTPAQLRDRISNGFGAVIQGVMSEIPASLRLSGYTGPHAIYVDAFYPGDDHTPAAYYVIDPQGVPSWGYEGDWWPASFVEAFGTALGGGRIATAWAAPPGGNPPPITDVVVPYVPSGGDEPDESPGPDVVPEPGDEDPGSPSLTPVTPTVTLGGFDILPWLELCLGSPPPTGCPGGVPASFAFIDLLGGLPPPAPSIELAFVDSDRPNVALVGFRVQPATAADVRFWQADASPVVVQAASSITPIAIGGVTTLVASLDVHAATTYHFQIVAGADGTEAVSPVGTFTTADGVTVFDVALSSVADPSIELATGLSPYPHPAAGGFVPPLAETLGAGCPGGVTFGGVGYCPLLDLVPDMCQTATVDYALEGIDGSGVTIRAFPIETGRSGDGSPSFSAVIEADGPAGSGSVEVGCLTPGLTYSLLIDVIGDRGGPLAVETLVVPGS